MALQGNMDPLALFGDEKTIRSEVRRVIDAFGPVGMGDMYLIWARYQSVHANRKCSDSR